MNAFISTYMLSHVVSSSYACVDGWIESKAIGAAQVID